jgi:hypothetical protein
MRSSPARSRKIPSTGSGGVATSPKHSSRPAVPDRISAVQPFSATRPTARLLRPPASLATPEPDNAAPTKRGAHAAPDSERDDALAPPDSDVDEAIASVEPVVPGAARDDAADDEARRRRMQHTAALAGVILVVVLAWFFGVKALRSASQSDDTPTGVDTTSAESTTPPPAATAPPAMIAPASPTPRRHGGDNATNDHTLAGSDDRSADQLVRTADDRSGDHPATLHPTDHHPRPAWTLGLQSGCPAARIRRARQPSRTRAVRSAVWTRPADPRGNPREGNRRRTAIRDLQPTLITSCTC